MSGEAHHIDVLLFHIDGKYPRRLGGIQNEQQPVGVAKRSHPFNVHQIARQVGSVGADHGLCIRPQELFKVPIVDLSLPVSGYEIQFGTLALQMVQWPQHGVVLQVGGDHMVPRPQQAVDGDIQCHGGVGGKAHMIGPLAAKQRRQLFPKAVNDPGGHKSLRMGAPAAVAPAVHGCRHSLCHSGGLRPGSGGVVQVDHGLTTFPAPASFSTMVYMLVTAPTASFSVKP